MFARGGFLPFSLKEGNTSSSSLLYGVSRRQLRSMSLHWQREDLGDPQRSGRGDQHKRTQHQPQLVDDREGLSRSQNDRVEVAGRGLADKANRIRLLRPGQESDTLRVLVNDGIFWPVENR
jgi:hypothetical protein